MYIIYNQKGLETILFLHQSVGNNERFKLVTYLLLVIARAPVGAVEG